MTWLLRRALTLLLSIPLVIAAPFLALLDASARSRRPPTTSRHGERRGSPRAEASATPPLDVDGMKAALTRSLDAVDQSRARFPYLARFEAKFAEHGLLVLENAPIKGLKRAHAEFEAMVRNWSDPLLAELRSRLAVSVAERASASAVWRASVSIAPIARAARNVIARASTFRASRAVDLDAVTR